MKSIQECEQTNIQRLLNFKLPNYAKKVGWALFTISLVMFLSTKFIEGEWELLKSILKRLVLLSLFIVVLSKEKVEDERIQHIRAKTFTLTFLITAIYILVQPIVNLIANSIIDDNEGVFQDLGDFTILWFMLFIYLMFFHFAKKKE